jgi:hypothetical protein
VSRSHAWIAARLVGNTTVGGKGTGDTGDPEGLGSRAGMPAWGAEQPAINATKASAAKSVRMFIFH